MISDEPLVGGEAPRSRILGSSDDGFVRLSHGLTVQSSNQSPSTGSHVKVRRFIGTKFRLMNLGQETTRRGIRQQGITPAMITKQESEDMKTGRQ
jgi:hypothetical protein